MSQLDPSTSDTPPTGPSGIAPQPTPVGAPGAVPAQIGPWSVVRLLGEGGFGVVYLGQRTNPAQQAAIKLIKPGLDSRSVLARFEAERQAMALLTHPHIARLYEAGVHDNRPYFAMEYVPGEPITSYATRHNLGIKQRLQLFQQICHAVQHAHLKTIIHRDISARNVLVTEIDGEANVKVIDFGIAKAVGVELTDQTIDTGAGNIIGNYAYMSPEQAAGDPDIDARTDVYSLGVLLYELLSGERPFDNATIQRAGDFGIRKLIVETEPPRPSSRTTISAEITTLLRRELEWIPLKALRKDRTRRYQTPNDFADDIQNYLDNKPLTAGPESRIYRLKKFSGRHRLPIATVAAAIALTISGTAFYIQRIQAEQAKTAAALFEVGLQKQEVTRQRDEAGRQRDRAQVQEAEAKSQTAVAEAVAKFQTDMLKLADPDKAMGNKVTVLEAMTAAAKSLDDGKLTDQPLVEAKVREAIGSTLFMLGEFVRAEASFRRALELRRKVLPAGAPDIAAAMLNLADALRELNKVEEAEPLIREALSSYRKSRPPGDEDIGSALTHLGYFLQTQHKLAEAERVFREALEIDRKRLAPGDQEIATGMTNVANVLLDTGRGNEAEPMFREALAIYRNALPEGHQTIASAINNLARVMYDRNRMTEAEPLYREALAMTRKVRAPGHPNIATALDNLGNVLRYQKKIDEAEPLFRESLDIRRHAFAADHPLIGVSLNSIARVMFLQDKYAEAEPLVREALAIARKSRPPAHPDITEGLLNLGTSLVAQKKLAEAEPVFREALENNRKALPAGHPQIAVGLINVAFLLWQEQKPAEAEPLMREAVEIQRKGLAPGDVNTSLSINFLATLLRAQNKLPEAEAAFAETLDLRTTYLGPTHVLTYRAAFNLADILDAQAATPGKHDQAEAVRKKYHLGDPATRPTTRPATQATTQPTTRATSRP